MSDKNKENKTNPELPDISGIFDIDEKKIPDRIIKKDPDTDKKIDNPILTSDEARKVLPKEDRKILKKEDRERKKIRFNKKIKKNLIIAAAVAAVILIIAIIAGAGLKEPELPEITVAVPSIEPMASYYEVETGKAFTVNDYQGKLIAFFDNKYDTHMLKEGLSAMVTSADGKQVNGKIIRISGQETDSAIIRNYYEKIEGKKASTKTYVVYIKPDDQSLFRTDGEIAKSVVITTEYIENALSVPAAAIITENGADDTKLNDAYYVLIYSETDSTVSRLPVTIGIEEDGKIQITSGLEPTAKIVTGRSEELYDLDDFDDGDKVRVKE